LGALVLPASASTIGSWTQTDISGYNLTLNYTSNFNVAKDDTLGIIINNIGNESINDSITITKINVSETSKATGSWTGSLLIKPNSTKTINLALNMITNDEASVRINIYYNVFSDLDNKVLVVGAHYPGAPEIISWSNNKTNNNATTLTVNTSEIVRFNATADQSINSWNWYRDNIAQSNNNNNFIASWNDAGTKTVLVNSNANGTSQTVTWTVTVVSLSGLPAPNITSWSNNKTNNDNRSFTINESERVKFNFTANQTLTSWLWTLNGNSLSNPFDTLSRTFNNEGLYYIGASGSNANGSTQVIVWNVTVLDTEGKKRKNATIMDWSPQIFDYINGTLNEPIDYSITTFEEMTTYNWSVDGKPVNGNDDGSNKYSYSHNWNNSSVGAHTVSFKGNNSDTKVEFRWYVNVYREGTYSGGNLFEIIDEALDNHITDLKIRLFKYKVSKGNGKSDYAAQKVNQLHDEIAKRQMTREALRKEFQAGNITIEEYVAALKQVQRDAKYNSKLAKGYANIVKDNKDNESEKEFKKISEIETQNDRKSSEKKNEEKTNNVKSEDKKTNNVNNAKNDYKKNNGNNEDSNNKGIKNTNNENKKKGNGKD
jgi:hypothetical protein